jgi:hypothetical protein
MDPASGAEQTLRFARPGSQAFGVWEHEGQELGGTLVAEREDALELAPHDERVGELAEGAEGELVLDFVAEQGAWGGDAVVVAGFGRDAVTVVPEGEGPAMLGVAEVVEPGELVDLGLPRDAQGRERDGPETEGHAGAGAGDDAREAHGICRSRPWRGWGEGRFFDARVLPFRHQAREVLRIGEEGEDVLDRVRKPLLGLEVVMHEEQLSAYSL